MSIKVENVRVSVIGDLVDDRATNSYSITEKELHLNGGNGKKVMSLIWTC